jgi:hypothetical protein
MKLSSAVAKINKKGILLVFPENNQKEPSSLWYEFFPRTKMRWEWDESGDNRVSDLWFLREKLSTSRQVVYSKWFRGRATVISFELFQAMLRILNPTEEQLSFRAREILDLLDEDSPLSTKRLKKLTDLQGRSHERIYNSAMKELWSRLMIVGFGEVDEGAFPSLAMGSTRIIFEEIWKQAQKLNPNEAEKTLERFMPEGTKFRKYFETCRKALPPTARTLSRRKTFADELLEIRLRDNPDQD